jgi:hypothetical protein
MAKKNKDLLDIDQRQLGADNSKKQGTGKEKENIGDNNIQTSEPLNSLWGEKAEKYLREQANIEDLPDEKDLED